MSVVMNKSTEHEVTRNKFNISDIDINAVKNDIDYMFHVEHELPMDWYIQLEATKEGLARLVVLCADAAVRRKLREAKYTIAKQLQDNVGLVVMNSLENTSETVIVDDSVKLSDL